MSDKNLNSVPSVTHSFPKTMLRATLVLAVAAAASASFVPKLNISSSTFTPKDARLLAWQNSSAAKLAVANAALNKTLSPKAAIAAELNITKQAIMVKLNKANATCSPGYYTISTRRRALLADNGCAQCGVGYVCPGAPAPQAPAPRYECPAGYTTTTPVATSLADCVLPSTPPCANTVEYGTFAQASSTSASVSTAPTNIFAATGSSAQATFAGAATSDVLGASTPWGQTYGSSAGKTYMSTYAGAGAGAQKTATYTFSTPCSPANQCGWALGDVDAESVSLSAIGTDGTPLTAAELGFQGTFNYAGAADQPSWNPGTSTLTGNNGDTNGATGTRIYERFFCFGGTSWVSHCPTRF